MRDVPETEEQIERIGFLWGDMLEWSPNDLDGARTQMTEQFGVHDTDELL